MTEPDDQAVEAVAKALHERYRAQLAFTGIPEIDPHTWENIPPDWRDEYRDQARAALAAIRQLDNGAIEGAMPEVVGRIAKAENDKIVGWLRGRATNAYHRELSAALHATADELERWGA